MLEEKNGLKKPSSGIPKTAYSEAAKGMDIKAISGHKRAAESISRVKN